MRLVIDGTPDEYRQFLEQRYRDGTWGNPLCAWIMEYFQSEDVPAESAYLNAHNSVSVGISTGSYADGLSATEDLEFAFPEWVAALCTFYWNMPATELTKDQALIHFSNYMPSDTAPKE